MVGTSNENQTTATTAAEAALTRTTPPPPTITDARPARKLQLSHNRGELLHSLGTQVPVTKRAPSRNWWAKQVLNIYPTKIVVVVVLVVVVLVLVDVVVVVVLLLLLLLL